MGKLSLLVSAPYCTFALFREAYVGRAQHPFTLGAVFDSYAGQIDALGGDVVAAEFLVLFCGGALFYWGHWFCHFAYTISFVDIESTQSSKLFKMRRDYG